MKKLYTIIGIFAGIILGVGSTAHAVSYLFPYQGGTGTSTAPVYGQMLVGTSAGVYQLQATSTLGITSTLTGGSQGNVAYWTSSSALSNVATTTVSAGTGITFTGTPGYLIGGTNLTINATAATVVGTVSTSSAPTIGNLSYWTSTAYPSLLGTVATTSLTATSPLSLSQPISVIGSSASALSISTAGTWSGNAGTATALAANGANCSAGSFPLGVDASGAVESCTVAGTGTVTSVTATSPIFSSGGATPNITWAGLATTSQPASSNLLVSNGGAGVFGVATSTISASGGITATAGQSIIGSGLTIGCTAASGSATGCLSSTDWSTFNNKGSGTVTSIATNNGLTGGTITTTGTLGLASLGSAGVLGAVTATVPTVQATSTLYGTGAFGDVLMNNSGLLLTATTSLFSWTGTGLSVRATSPTLVTPALGTPSALVLTNATGLPVAGGGTGATTLTGVLVGNGTSAFTAVGAQTCTNQFIRVMSGAYVATCATVGAADVSLANLTATDGTLTFSGTYTGATARTIGLNLGNANTWTALQTFSNASSTQFSAATQTFYIDSNGRVQGKDTTNAWSGVVSPTRSFGLQTGTTTTWTASTTNSAYSPFMTMPFAGTLRQVRCTTDASFVGVNTQVNGSDVTPNYFVASTTVGRVSFTAGNTFTEGQKILVNFGTTTTSTTKSISCTYDVTETP
ncbi:MAG: hypothetical protein AAB922_05755 [Patescibacteria group bacterium]